MSNQFNGGLLVVARDARGMSQSDLAAQAEITQGHLSKIENALTEPSPEIAKRLAEALDFPEAFFFQSERVYTPLSIHRNYRRKAFLSQRKLAQVHAEISIRLLHIKKLLKGVRFSPDLSLPQFDINEYEGDTEKIADLVRYTWHLPKGPVTNLIRYMERAGILVVRCDFSGLEVDGITILDPEAPPCVFININQPADRERFTLAHELGHIIMHAIPTPGMEQEANGFASGFLMPAKDIRASFVGKLTLETLARLKSVWQVSMQSLLIRSKSLKMITPHQYQYLWKQISFYGMRRREPASTEFSHEELTIFPELIKMHLGVLGYTTTELLKTLHLFETDFLRLYGFADPAGRGRHLRIIA